MKHKKLLFALSLMAVVSVAYAAFLISHDINTTMIIKPTVSMEVFDTDAVTPLLNINMGQFTWGTEKYFPEGNPTPPTTYYFVNNTDQVSFYVSFTWTNLPTGNMGYGFYVKRGDQADFTFVANSAIYQLPIESPVVNPDPATQYAQWYLYFNVVSAEFGTYYPVLRVSAYDSGSG